MINNILELNNILKNNTNYKFSNLTNDFAKFLLLELIQDNSQDSLIIFSTDAEAEQFYDFVKLYSDISINFFPSFSIEPYQNVSPHKSLMVKRIEVLSNIYLNKNQKNIVVTSVLGIIQKTIAKKYLDNNFLFLKTGNEFKMSALVEFLISKNYKKVSLVSEEGEFALRGDILDICSPEIGAIRIDFFDDNIERMRRFDVISQKSYEDILEINIKPSSEIFLNEKTIDTFKHNYLKFFIESNKKLFELLDNNILSKGIENYITLFYEETATILDYLKDYNVFSFDNFDYHLKQTVESYQEEYNYLINEKNIFKSSENILPPNALILNENEVISKIEQQSRYYLSKTRVDEENNINFDVRLLAPEFSVYKKREKSPLYALINFIKDNSDKQFLIFVSTDTFSEKLRVMLKGSHICFSLNKKDNQQVSIINNSNIQEGFIIDNRIIITEYEITGIKKTFSSKKKKSGNKILQQLSTIEIDDIIVHVKHGFGRYKGIQTLPVNGAEHDFLEIEYKNNEKLYVPVENIDDITRKSSNNDEINLDKLGSTAFEKKSSKIKEKIKDIAYDLIQLAAQRILKKAPIIDFNQEDYDDFLKGFPYVETEDQQNAINDVIKDLTTGIPSDRLICGDVGFGKTEVILRGAFLTANSGYQVAVISPTTLLCNQHYNNFKERFKDFPIRIEQLSRFSTPIKRKQYKKELSDGKIDIIVGTHALLAKDIKFKNLSLIVIDEEQSFGVLHKEKLKTLKEEVHILTLSATPIPRTIQLAFKGIKELSTISTPPVDKLPIITYVLPIDYIAIKKALLKEKERGGQIFFVCPRISDIGGIKTAIDNLNLDISYAVAHGQMPTEIIEQNMLDFKEKQYDMLISTNIIESGIDLHNVNTIIILRSDIMGLAQLYQLRGRVGRGQNQAYAYLLYDNLKPLNPKAEKRLQVLQNLDYLGAGFSLATYDLDMRGAGNLLGEEQSGQVEEIGSELYQKLLEQEIKHIKNIVKKDSNQNASYYNFSPNISLNIPVFIPKKYISDMETAMEIYQRIGAIETYQEIVDVKEELQDRFGNLPYQVENLLTSIELKISAKLALIEKIIFGSKGIQLTFYKQSFNKVDELLNYIQSKQGLLNLKPEGSIVISSNDLESREQIRLTLQVLEDIKNL